jgi:hypothetical protein
MGIGGLGALAKGDESAASTPGTSAPVSHRLLGELDEGRDSTAAFDLYDLTDFDFTPVDLALLNSGRLRDPGTPLDPQVRIEDTPRWAKMSRKRMRRRRDAYPGCGLTADGISHRKGRLWGCVLSYRADPHVGARLMG